MQNLKKLLLSRPALIVTVIAIALYALFFTSRSFRSSYISIEGPIFGTIYHITYDNSALNPVYQEEIEEVLQQVDASLSTFNPTSILSRINQNDTTVVVDEWLTTVYRTAEKVSTVTDGAFDITVAPLVNAWGFGFKNHTNITPQAIDSLREFVGFNKISLNEGKLLKNDDRIQLDCSAIAKGYACDIVGNFLRCRGVRNFMVEIGGEIYCEGFNSSQNKWRVGINKPIEDSTAYVNEYNEILSFTNRGLATSGNYRNFYYKDGKKYAHTIDPKTGYPVEHTLLSATVIAPTCIISDAYATAFMVLGVEKSLQIVENSPQLEALFICTNPHDSTTHINSQNNSEYLIIRSSGMNQYVYEKK